MLPFSFTFFISFSYFIGLNIIAYIYNNSNYFNLFLPSGVPELIIPLITFVEFMSFFTRMFSLSIRLFANMMAGHTLLKILSFFLYSMLFGLNIFPSILFGIAFLTFIIIFVITLEICISFLQSYVFITLMILYLNDIFYIH
jgi:ATP synthase subunit 6